MGNKLGRRRQAVDDRYTKPQGLYQHKDVDQKRLRKLILDSKLAPCYPGDDESTMDLEECPICFLYYPSLNRSRCCLKGICTECFLQMKSPNSARPTQCPFCKTSDYAVEFRGVKSKEEKGIEQMEEQRIIEAKIRIRKQEIQEEEERMQKRKETTSTRQTNVQGDLELNSETAPFQESATVSGQPQLQTHDGDDEFDLDLDNLMVNEAIWLSLQESGRQRNGIYQDPTGEGHAPGDLLTPMHESLSAPSRGLAHAIASMAEHQQMTVDSSTPHGRYWVGEVAENCPLPQNYNSSLLQGAEGWGAAELGGGGGYVNAALDAMDDGEEGSLLPPPPPPPLPLSMPVPLPVPMDVNGVGFQSLTGEAMVPESYEEQVLLAMAVSLADGRARTSHMAVGYGDEFIE